MISFFEKIFQVFRRIFSRTHLAFYGKSIPESIMCFRKFVQSRVYFTRFENFISKILFQNFCYLKFHSEKYYFGYSRNLVQELIMWKNKTVILENLRGAESNCLEFSTTSLVFFFLPISILELKPKIIAHKMQIFYFLCLHKFFAICLKLLKLSFYLSEKWLLDYIFLKFSEISFMEFLEQYSWNNVFRNKISRKFSESDPK